MSGGAFDYDCFRVSSFAEELKNKLDENEIMFLEETEKLLRDIQRMLEVAGAVAKEVEWLYSGDTGEETFTARIKDIDSRYPFTH